MQFKNLRSGNILTVTNEKAIEIMKRSSDYVEVTKKAVKKEAKAPERK